MNRRSFLRCGILAAAGTVVSTTRCAGFSTPSVTSIFGADTEAKLPDLCTGKVMTVDGDIKPSKMGITLPHEHIVCDLNATTSAGAIRYNMEKAFTTVLSHLLALKRAGCDTLVECTPAYMGRNVKFLQRLSKASGLNILTNTGCYGASKNRYLPPYVLTDSADDLAFRWIREAWYGIGDTGIRPGFIKIGVDEGGLSPVQGKLFQAAGKAHLQTGLPMMVHSTDSIPIAEGLSLLRKMGLNSEALIWAHASAATDEDRLEQAKMGVWLGLDGLSTRNTPDYVKMLTKLKEADLLDRVLLSHDNYWSVEPGEQDAPLKREGETSMYMPLFSALIPQLKKSDFSKSDIRQITGENPKAAFEIGVRRGKPVRKKYLLF